MRPSNNFQKSNLILIKTKKRFFCNLSCTILLLINKYLLNVKNIIVSKTLKAFLLLFCGPPTQDMGLMRPAISKIGHMRPPSQFEFETPALRGAHGTPGFRGTPVEKHWSRLLVSTVQKPTSWLSRNLDLDWSRQSRHPGLHLNFVN
jgi:hypothetical protein